MTNFYKDDKNQRYYYVDSAGNRIYLEDDSYIRNPKYSNITHYDPYTGNIYDPIEDDPYDPHNPHNQKYPTQRFIDKIKQEEISRMQSESLYSRMEMLLQEITKTKNICQDLIAENKKLKDELASQKQLIEELETDFQNQIEAIKEQT